MKSHSRAFSFMRNYESLTEVLIDNELASLGDAFVNFVYSLALSNRKGRPLGVRVKGTLLAEALRRAGLREHIPSRMTSHSLADAAEALTVYAWLRGCITLEECSTILKRSDEPVEGLSQLLEEIVRRVKLS